ncbi:MAG: GtrA family protein [bacterium]|nr:GtrA family protein [bacterium]MDZ4299794.1 GtrA family protein [Candidatus Sungbacteria bacterium]
MLTKMDYAIGGLIGFFVGIFAIPTIINLGVHAKVTMRFGVPPALFLLALPWIMVVVYLIAVRIGDKLSRKILLFTQLTRFGAVGVLNTVIDFGVLNLLSIVTGFTAGFLIAGVNVPGFLLGATNSYFWNKLWVFAKKDNQPFFHDLSKFAIVTILGAVINGGIVGGVTVLIHSGVAPAILLNAAKAGATIITLVWNFVGYKLFVFRSDAPTGSEPMKS